MNNNDANPLHRTVVKIKRNNGSIPLSTVSGTE